MQTAASGQPLHTRALSITVAQGASAHLDARGVLLDLRKRGFVPVGGDLQPAGIVHQMVVEAEVDPEGPRLLRIEAEQPAVAFEPSAVTGGESCRDPVARVRSLAGAPLDAAFPRAVGAGIGGPRGCTHLYTLVQLLGAALPWALRRERELFGEPPARAPGERAFRRDLAVDGFRLEDGGVELVAQLSELHLRPAPPRARPVERFGGQLELCACARVDTAAMRLVAVTAAERRRTLAELESAPWRSLDAGLEGLAGLALRPGVAGEIVRRCGSDPQERPLLDVLLALTPALYQCLAVLSERGLREAKLRPTLLGLAGLPDSCFMWRRGGALDRARR